MQPIRFFRILLLVLIVAVVFTVVCTSAQFDQISCMEVPVLSEADMPPLIYKIDTNLSGYFFFKGEPAAVDQDTGTIYISQNIDNHTQYQDLEGHLRLAYQDFSLYFLPDPCFSDLKSAMAANHPFQLLAVNPAGDYAEYNVVFTSFPIINLIEDTAGSETIDSLYSGRFCLWTSDDPDQLRYSVKTSSAEWHVRGMTSSYMDKKPWKLTLTSQHTPISLSLLGLGKDDDWILNSMCLDDTLLKEQLFMQLWNQMAAETTYNYPMSSGKYVELIINRKYRGVYLMQRRIDQRYLDLPSDAVLFKGRTNESQPTAQDTYELVYSPLDEEKSFALLDNMWNKNDSMYHVDSFVDVNLFLHFASALDNTGYKNMFYVFNPTASGHVVTLIPWDTDMSFGVLWTDDFTYDYEKSINSVPQRMEYNAMQKLHPDLHDRMAARWLELRNGVFAEENILSVLSELEALLLENGASARNSQKWGNYYGGSDTADNLYRYIHEKLSLMDAFYAQ